VRDVQCRRGIRILPEATSPRKPATATGANELSFPSRFTSRPPNYERNLPVAEALCKRIHPKKKSFMVPKDNGRYEECAGKAVVLNDSCPSLAVSRVPGVKRGQDQYRRPSVILVRRKAAIAPPGEGRLKIFTHYEKIMTSARLLLRAPAHQILIMPRASSLDPAFVVPTISFHAAHHPSRSFTGTVNQLPYKNVCCQRTFLLWLFLRR
jgi:hypothetical protein